MKSTLALRTPRYNGHPDNTDSSKIPGKNKLQTFHLNNFPLLRTLATLTRGPTVSAVKGVDCKETS